MKTRMDHNGDLPGSTLFVHAALSEYGVPVEHRAQVNAELRRPSGSMVVLPMLESSPAQFVGQVHATEGSTLRGRPFTWEDILTAAITSHDQIATLPPITHRKHSASSSIAS